MLLNYSTKLTKNHRHSFKTISSYHYHPNLIKSPKNFFIFSCVLSRRLLFYVSSRNTANVSIKKLLLSQTINGDVIVVFLFLFPCHSFIFHRIILKSNLLCQFCIKINEKHHFMHNFWCYCK